MKTLLCILFLFCAAFAVGQNYNVNVGGIQYTSGASVPGSCSRAGSWFFKNTSVVGWYECIGGVYVPVNGGVAGSVPFSGVTAGTNTAALVTGTGGTLLPSGTGQIVSNGYYISTASIAAPSPVGTNTCAGNPSGWTQNAAGTYQTQFAVDTTLTSTSDSTFPGGLVSCRPILFNSTGVANPTGSGNATAFSIYSNFSVSPNRHFAVQSYFANDVADSGTYTTGNLGTFYGDFEINGTPTVNATFVSTLRHRLDDNKTGGSKPRVWSVYQGETSKTAVYDITNCVGGIDGFINGPCYSIFYGEQGTSLGGTESEAGAVYDVFAGGTKDLGHHATDGTGNVFHALVQSSTGNRFDNSNGFKSEDFGTASGYYNFLSLGVNSAGTASGFNAFVGPLETGAGVHPGAGVQFEVQGGSINQLQTYTGTAALNNVAFTLTESPSATVTGATNVLSLSNSSAMSQAQSGRMRGLFVSLAPSGAGALTRLEGLTVSAVPTNTAVATNIGAYINGEMLHTSGTTTNNQGIRVLSGQGAAGGVITQDDSILVTNPDIVGVLTHHAGIHLTSGHSTGANNPDGWAILLDGAADKTKIGPLFTNSDCVSAGGTCGGATTGKVSIAAAATTVTVSTTAVTANSEIFIQEDSTWGTALSVTCNTTIARTYAVTTRTAATSFVISSSVAPIANPACLSFRIIN
jgi:hypothetical protein